jgi:paraquat-inducible protein B
MLDPAVAENPPQAITHRSRRISIIWIVPIVAVAIGAWLAWDTLSKEGPTITVTFESAEGLQAGQSQLKYKDIVFGTVKSVTLSKDLNHVVTTIATTREAEHLLTEGTVFWVVKPRLFAGNISGLETLLSGSYVGMMPPEAPGKAKRDFAGQEDPPILAVHTPGHTFLLRSRRIGAISVGSPVFFRDLNVGEVLGWDVGNMAASVTLHVFVRAPYDNYVHDETRFWDASGLSIKLGASGIDVQMESLRALLLGGIAFETPVTEARTPAATEEHPFPLFANREEARSASYTRVIAGVSFFNGSVSGLAAGSEVTMHGLKIGQVTDVHLAADPATGLINAEVHYEVQPERVVGIGQRQHKTDQEAVAALLDRGLRASLESANLLTGQQTVAMEFVTDAPPATVKMQGTDFVIPSSEGGGFSGLASSATEVLGKVNKIPFAQIGSNLNGILQAVNTATDGPELKNAVASLAATLSAAHDLVQKVDTGTTPAVKHLPEIAAELQTALGNVNKLVVGANAGYGDDTKFHRDLDRVLVQTDDALRGVRALADLLAQHPEALIKGRSQ